jgi:hypothetical protein
MIGRIEQLCAHLSEKNFAQLAAEYGVTAPLLRIVEAVRAGEQPDHLEPDLDAVDDAFARHGTSGVTSGKRTFREIPGQLSGHPTVRVRVCPAPRRCARQVLGTHDEPRECAITGLPMIEIDVTG